MQCTYCQISHEVKTAIQWDLVSWLNIKKKIKKNQKYSFLNNYTENEVGRLIPDLLSIFEKALYEEIINSVQLNIFW